jgi:hypothetical protein
MCSEGYRWRVGRGRVDRWEVSGEQMTKGERGKGSEWDEER